MSQEAALKVRDLTVAYHDDPAIWDVDLDIPVGAMAAIIGPNGAGKSTLLKAALGLVPAQAGMARFFGLPLAKAHGRVGYVPQRSAADWDFPVSAFDVALMGTYGRLGWVRRPGKAERQDAMAALAKVGMVDYRDRQISQLSGGQQQRVFLARALAEQADLYLMDEPFAGVDATTERAIIDVLRELQGQGKTVVAVHHDLDTAADYFDHAVLLNVRLYASGPMDEVFTQEILSEVYGQRLASLHA